MNIKQTILVTGSSGYIGSRLIPVLLNNGHSLKCSVRSPIASSAVINDNLEIVEGDLRDDVTLDRALTGVDTAYFLIHSMADSDQFAAIDLQLAERFSKACDKHKVKRIIYLGGLGSGKDLSEHLKSRQQVGEVLKRSQAIVIELRASIIVGPGSLSFEMIRSLVDRLPVMITPSWVRQKTQPISIYEVIDYLIKALDIEIDESDTFEIGGNDILSYGDLIKEYAQKTNKQRLLIPVPVLTPKLSSLWLGLVTPLQAKVGKKLIDSVKNATIVNSVKAKNKFCITPRKISETMDDAIAGHDLEKVNLDPSLAPKSSVLSDKRFAIVNTTPENAFRPIKTIGGNNGYYYANWLWRSRGFVDSLIGGIGFRSGRRDNENIEINDTVDFWRVEEYLDNRLLRLKAELKMPGVAWLQYEVHPLGDKSKIVQTAFLEPSGLLGVLYWYLLLPLHLLIWSKMIKNISDKAYDLESDE